MDKFQQKLNFNKILDNVIQYAMDYSIYYYDSIESYYSREEPTIKRKIKFYGTFLLLVIFTVKYGLVSLYPDIMQWKSMKDATMMFGDQAFLMHAIFFILALVTTLGKSVMVYYEWKKELAIFDMIVAVKTGKQEIRYIISLSPAPSLRPRELQPREP